MNVSLLFAVAAGGAVGAVGRFLVMAGVGHWIGHGFPWGTMVVNILGSFILGILLEVSALVWSPSPEMRAFLVIGLLGAFTTFSAFSMEGYYLFDRSNMWGGIFYVGGSICLGVIAFWAGIALIRQVAA